MLGGVEHYVVSRSGRAIVGRIRHRRTRRGMKQRAEMASEATTEVFPWSALDMPTREFRVYQPSPALPMPQRRPEVAPRRHRMPFWDRVAANAKDPAWHAHARRCLGTGFATLITSFASMTVLKCAVMVLTW